MIQRFAIHLIYNAAVEHHGKRIDYKLFVTNGSRVVEAVIDKVEFVRLFCVGLGEVW